MSRSTTPNGARTGGLNEKPKMTSLAASAVGSLFSASLGSESEAGSVGMRVFVH
jgi:hypothetical protein